MVKYFKKIDTFGKNIILVFLGTSLMNFFNLLYQLLIAHRLSPSDFAAFNSLLAILMILSSPLGPLQVSVAKYSAEFNARNQTDKIKILLSRLFKITSLIGLIVLLLFSFLSFYIIDKLKIPSVFSGYILALLISFSFVSPVFGGVMLGLELFAWLMAVSLITGLLKLLLAVFFIWLGFNITGALAALFVSAFIGLILYYFPLKNFFTLGRLRDGINFKEIFIYIFPVAISSFCYMVLTNLDMVLVKYFFPVQESGYYSIAQMVGKISLFFPVAICIVMFPRTSGLSARNMDTLSMLKRSLLYASALCLITILGYNLFPVFTLKILTGKPLPNSVILGRLFSLSMSFFALINILSTYFVSIKDLRFIKYLVLFTGLQVLAIILFHNSLIQVQLILCINAILLFSIHLILAYKKGTVPAIAN
jgi:O-antigen/teichoic acid export membrane protein